MKFNEYVGRKLKSAKFQKGFQARRFIHGIAIKIRELRKAVGMTQAQLADAIGSSQPVIARLETSGHHTPQWKLLSRIADALGKQLTLDFVDKEPVAKAPKRKRAKAIAADTASAARLAG